jgi:pyruvate,orthophosphate dikinase
LVAAIEAVLASWWSPRARGYRRLHALDDAPGTGVLIQAMVFGNSGARSGSGVGFTRSPDSGENALFLDFLANAQGEDIVSGRDPVCGSGSLRELLPDVWERLSAAKHTLEHEFLDMQDFEFTIVDGHLFFLQTRAGKRTPWAALQIAVDLVGEGLIAPAVALQRLSAYDLSAIERRTVAPGESHHPIARGTAGAHGAASGAVVFDVTRARERAARAPVILLRTELTTEDIEALAVASGIVSTYGGATSHAAVVARQLGKVCIVNCAELQVLPAAGEATLGLVRLREGDVVTLDGETGLIYAGEVPVVATRPSEALAEIDRWRRWSAA